MHSYQQPLVGNRTRISYYKNGSWSGLHIIVLISVLVGGAGLGVGIAGLVKSTNNGNTITMTKEELIVLIEERVSNINNVEPEMGSKRAASDGGIELIGSNGITIDPNPSLHQIGIGTDASVLKTDLYNVPNGVAQLDANSMIDGAQLPLTALQVVGDWSPGDNIPELVPEDCNNSSYGFTYIINQESDVERFGYSNWTLNDFLVCTQNMGFIKNDHGEPLVTSVNGQTGAVELSYSDLLNLPTPTCTSGQVIESIDANGDPTCITAGFEVDGVPTDGQLLQYDGGTATWKPYDIPYTQIEDVLAADYIIAATNVIENWASVTLTPGTYLISIACTCNGVSSILLCTGTPGAFTNGDIVGSNVIYNNGVAINSMGTAPQLVTPSVNTTYYACIRSATGGARVQAENPTSTLINDPDNYSKISAIRLA